MLRPYQRLAEEQVRAAWAAGHKPIAALPTGSGKTVLAHALSEGGSLVLAHTAQIVLQTARRFAPCGVLMGAQTRDLDLPVVVASIQTIASRGTLDRPVLIIDEAHRAAAASYAPLIQAHPRVLGLTATPCRLDGRGLASAGFTTILEPASFSELVSAGYLLLPEVWAGPRGPDMRGARTVAGDYAPDDAAKRMVELDGDVVAHWSTHARGRRAVAFACNVAHARSLAGRLVLGGARAEVLVGTDGLERRASVLGALRAGHLDVIVSVALLSEGWDEPSLDVAILARPTKSLTVHRQQIGRITRPTEGKRTPLVLDHAGNTHRLGFVDEPVAWSLTGRIPKREAHIAKTCAACLAVYAAHHASCPHCGATVARDGMGRVVVEHADAKLAKLTRGRDTLPDPRAVADAVAPGDMDVLAYAYIVRKGIEKGYKSGWARHAYKAKRGDWPGAWAGFVERRFLERVTGAT